MATTAAIVITPFILLHVLPRIRKPTPKPIRAARALPEGVIRTTTPTGLELLIAHPRETAYEVVDGKAGDEKAPILLLHGGFGSALCYIKWLPYLAEQGRTVYSLSLTGHGRSPRPTNFVTMEAKDFAPDLTSTLSYIHTLHPTSPLPILVGHSAGGGLSQHVLGSPTTSPLDSKRGTVTSGLVLLDAFPPSGGWSVYLNWALLDPLFALRMIYHGGDPKSPLSTPSLVNRIFFGPYMTPSNLNTFFEDMNHEESISWPQSMMFPFVNVERVKERASEKVAWISGDKDAIMTPKVMKKAAEEFGAPLRLVKGAGHHVPRDEVWKEGADALLAQLDEWEI
ncbi:alpha/beta-hydrolase [Serendipita vermifera]|nr:alpha/beta-hydrolase [Serendipita vermifera]